MWSEKWSPCYLLTYLLYTGKPFPVHNQPPRSLSLPSVLGRLYRLRQSVFSCVGWQVTLCDPAWQVIPCSSDMTCSGVLYRLTLNL